MWSLVTVQTALVEEERTATQLTLGEFVMVKVHLKESYKFILSPVLATFLMYNTTQVNGFYSTHGPMGA